MLSRTKVVNSRRETARGMRVTRAAHLTLQYHFVAVSLIVQERPTKGLMRPTRTGRLADAAMVKA